MKFLSRAATFTCLSLALVPPLLAQSPALPDVLVVYEAFDPADDSRPSEIHALRLGADPSQAAMTPYVLASLGQRPLGSMDIIPDGAGGAFLGWAALDPDSFNGDIRLQHLDGQGRPMWSAPLAITDSPEDDSEVTLAEDGLGGCLVAWSCTNAEFTTTAHLLRVDASGARVWEAGLEAGPTFSTYASRPVADGKGGAFQLATSISAETLSTCMVQHVGAHGEALWEGGARQLFTSGESESLERAFLDGTGALLAVGSTMSFTDGSLSSCAVLAQRVEAQGKRLWGEPGCLRILDPLGCAGQPMAVPDGKGGLLLAYVASDPSQPASSDNLPDTDVLAQRVDASGKLLWVETPMLILGGLRHECQLQLFATADAGCVLVAASLDRHAVEPAQLLGERLSSTGAAKWAKAGEERPPLLVGQATTGQLRGLWRGTGVDLFFLEEGEGGSHLLWTRVDAMGEPRSAGPLTLLAGPLSQRGMKVVALSGR